jgi:hypothetical protein
MDVEQYRTTERASEDRIPNGDWYDKPAVPATTVAVENETDFHMWVEITGGTVTAVTIDGESVGRTSGMFILRPGSSVAITHSSAPTWKWFPLF